MDRVFREYSVLQGNENLRDASGRRSISAANESCSEFFANSEICCAWAAAKRSASQVSIRSLSCGGEFMVDVF